MLITPNYSAISVIPEGELRLPAEGKAWKDSVQQAWVLKKTTETLSRAGFNCCNSKCTDRLHGPCSLGASPAMGTSPGQAPRQLGVGASTSREDSRMAGARGTGLQRREGGEAAGQTPSCRLAAGTPTRWQVRSHRSPFRQRLPVRPRPAALWDGLFFSPATRRTDGPSREPPARLGRAALPDAACHPQSSPGEAAGSTQPPELFL